jgi:uncharacterized membrane protein
MLTQMKSFFKTSLLGGVIVLLPTTILVAVFIWIVNLVREWIRPATDLVIKRANLQEFVATCLVITIIVCTCFLVGVAVRTSIGRFIHNVIETRLLVIAPGYRMVKEVVMQFLGNRKSPFSSVAVVRLFDSDTLATAFVTDTHPNGWYSVFVPTGPNPTSGLIYHLKPEAVQIIDEPVDRVMRSILSCGAGSTTILAAYEKARQAGKTDSADVQA